MPRFESPGSKWAWWPTLFFGLARIAAANPFDDSKTPHTDEAALQPDRAAGTFQLGLAAGGVFAQPSELDCGCRTAPRGWVAGPELELHAGKALSRTETLEYWLSLSLALFEYSLDPVFGYCGNGNIGGLSVTPALRIVPWPSATVRPFVELGAQLTLLRWFSPGQPPFPGLGIAARAAVSVEWTLSPHWTLVLEPIRGDFGIGGIGALDLGPYTFSAMLGASWRS